MTMTLPEGLDQRRERIQRAHDASVAARVARREAEQAERMAGALADRRAAADGLVTEASRRLRAVRTGRPLMILLALRGTLRAERAVRAQTYEAATTDRDGVVAKVHAYLQEAADRRREMSTAAAQAASLPRLLDEAALLVRAAGGAAAAHLADSEAAIIPALQREDGLTRALQAARAAQDGLHAALDGVASAYAWARYEGAFGQTEALDDAVAGLLVELRAVTGLLGVADVPSAVLTHGVTARLTDGPAPGTRVETWVQELLSAARAVLLTLDGHCTRLDEERAAVLHELASARAVRTAILRGAL